jgi:hypothetical protein
MANRSVPSRTATVSFAAGARRAVTSFLVTVAVLLVLAWLMA